MLLGRHEISDAHEIGINEIAASKHDLVGGNWRAFDRADDVDEAVIELERVEITDDNNSFVRISGLTRLDQVRKELRLRPSLRSHSRAVGRVVDSRERAQMIDDDRDRKSSSARRGEIRAQHQRRAIVERLRVAVIRIHKRRVFAYLRY